MKVRNVKSAEYGLQSIRSADTADGIQDSSVTFKRALTVLSAEQHQSYMNELVQEIDKQGERLSKRADIKEFEKYRQLIREFLDEIVSNGYSFTKDNAFGSRGRYRYFAIVKTIDQKLEEMAKEVISGQADSIALLHRIDDIRGLILDMML